MINKVAVILTVIIALIIGLLTWVAFHYHGVAVTAQAENKTLSDQLVSQSAIVARQAADFQKFNSISATAGQVNTQAEAKSQEVEIEYRTILKNNPTCDLYIDAHIANGLYDYANRLRASAMYADSGSTLKTAVSATTSPKLTYCQAVLWIDPLLTIIEQNFNNLKAISAIEASRQK